MALSGGGSSRSTGAMRAIIVSVPTQWSQPQPTVIADAWFVVAAAMVGV